MHTVPSCQDKMKRTCKLRYLKLTTIYLFFAGQHTVLFMSTYCEVETSRTQASC